MAYSTLFMEVVNNILNIFILDTVKSSTPTLSSLLFTQFQYYVKRDGNIYLIMRQTLTTEHIVLHSCPKLLNHDVILD